MLTSERFLDFVLREALEQAIKHHKPAWRRCKSWHREVTQWTVVAQNARSPRFWLPLLTFTRTQTARSQARKQTQIWLRYTRRCTELSQQITKELPGIEWSLHSVLLWMVGCKKQRLMEGVFLKSQFRCWRPTVLFLPRKNYVEGCNGRTLKLSARHSLRHVAPIRVSMYQNLSAIVVTSIGFQNLPWNREVVTLPNERLDSQHDEGQFSECHLRAADGIWSSDVFTILAMF